VAGSLVVIALAASPGTGIAQERGRSASPEELWRDYPLRPEEEAGGTGAQRSVDASPEPREERADDPGPPAGAIVLLALLVVPLLALLARLAPIDVRGLLGRPRVGRSPPDSPAAAASPAPAHGSPWTAEIEWRSEDGASRFCVVASPPGGADGLTLGESPHIEWPPRNAADVDSLVGAVSDLERAVVAAGWEPTDPGTSWYARRFVWPWTDRVPERTLDHVRAGDRA
jgi:hypothetical protein